MSGDYRDSHAHKGLDYDATLVGTPLDAYMARWEAHWLAHVVRELHPTGVPRYLDFACGTGRVTQVVAPLARDSVGVDISASMLAVAREKCPQTRFVHADLTREACDDLGTFDLATAFRFFGNAQDDLRDAVLGAIVERLRPGGHLIVNSHRNPWSVAALLDRVTGGNQGMDLHYPKLRRLLGRHGLTVVRAYPIGAHLWRSSLLLRAGSDPRDERRERTWRWPPLAVLSPDAVVVAQRAPAAA